ncbi:MAG TPA: LacI family DNA-binding transcriptional regulator [Acidobacteriaceae bacterium]|nr:LacI family DNA-binding transcriptional regulator [Acidobacteriaceae bacterium]
MDIQEVARRAKVSTATVSRVLNNSGKVREDTAKRVRRVIESLNYIPNNSARNLRIGRSELFGLVVSDIKNPFFPELIDHFEELATAKGINVIFTHTNYDDQRMISCIQRLVERNVDGIAVMTSEVSKPALELATRGRVPVVLLNQSALAAKYASVLVDYTRGYREAVVHLEKLGHRDIAFLSGSSTFSSVRRRQEAFRSAIEKSELKFRKECLLIGDLRVEGGRKAVAELLRIKPRPTALVATNDLMAVGVLQAAQAAGLRVPEDLSIIGFDDIPIAAMMHPELTTIHLSRREIASNAFAQLMHLCRKDVTPRPDLLHKIYPRLVVRGSTAPPQGKRSRR